MASNYASNKLTLIGDNGNTPDDFNYTQLSLTGFAEFVCTYESGPSFGNTLTGMGTRITSTEAFSGSNGKTFVIRAPAYLFEVNNGGTLNWAFGATDTGFAWSGTPTSGQFPGQNPRAVYRPQSQFEVIGGLGVGTSVAGIYPAGDGDILCCGHISAGTQHTYEKINAYGNISTAEMAGAGIILRSSGGNRFKLTVNDDGTLATTAY